MSGWWLWAFIVIGFYWQKLPGALLGVLLYYVLRKVLPKRAAQRFSNPFLDTLVAILAKMSKAEGAVTKKEIEQVNLIFEKLHLRGQRLKMAREIFRLEKDSDTSVETHIAEFKRITNNDPSMSEILYTCLQAIAQADGKMSPEERDILRLAERELNIHKHEEERNAVSSGNMTQSAAAEVLEVSTHATTEEIQVAYRKKCADMHPDKLVSKGLPKELIDFAEQKMAQYNEARDVLLG